MLRLGAEPLALTPTNDTPLIGGYLDEAVTGYNVASAMYNQAHGYTAGSPKASASIDRSAFALNTTLLTFAPALELGTEHVALRIEGLFGISNDFRRYGVALDPIDLSLPLGRSVALYLVAGGTASWLERADVADETGALFTVRVAAGVRVVQHIALEVGYSAYAAGGVLDTKRLHSMASYDPMGDAPPPVPDQIISGGTQSGMVDISIAIVL